MFTVVACVPFAAPTTIPGFPEAMQPLLKTVIASVTHSSQFFHGLLLLEILTKGASLPFIKSGVSCSFSNATEGDGGLSVLIVCEG